MLLACPDVACSRDNWCCVPVLSREAILIPGREFMGNGSKYPVGTGGIAGVREHSKMHSAHGELNLIHLLPEFIDEFFGH